jgi:NAD(P)-dependent dehydrogenase (short-subunit alcohol dehydrogenase family)
MGRLEGQVAVITGAASGIGRAVLERFTVEGARVIAVDLAGERTDTLRALAGVSVVAGDVRDPTTNTTAVETALTAFGQLDVFVGNAGIFDAHAPLSDIPLDRLGSAAEELFAVNVTGYLLGARAACEALGSAGGSMIFTASPAGLYPVGGGVLYTASKHAVVGIVRRLAYELAPRIRVNGVAPGATVTDLRGPSALGLDDRSLSGAAARQQAARSTGGRSAEVIAPEDHAGTYVHLASRHDAGTITGQIIESLGTDGGLWLHRRRT